MPVLLLECAVQNYPWGSTESIPRLLQRPNPNNKPWAELWMGAHPRAPSTLASGQSLADYIAEDSPARLGHQVAGATLPFLFKILAAQSPLSIQCHPTRQQAEAGFDAEERAGIPIDARQRNYRDRNHKTELIVALEEIWALKGFRAPEEIVDLFRRAQVLSLQAALGELEAGGELATFYQGLLAMPESDKQQALTELAQGAGQLPEAVAYWTGEFMRLYPGDIGACSALLLRLVQLAPGQALYVDAGELHAYLRGTGLEIMANSDNVLRGGLTRKHVDLAELMRVLRFEYPELDIVEPQVHGALSSYNTPSSEFALSCLGLGGVPTHSLSVSSASIILSLGGSAQLGWKGGSLSLGCGQVGFCSADTQELEIAGDAQLWIATIPGSAV